MSFKKNVLANGATGVFIKVISATKMSHSRAQRMNGASVHRYEVEQGLASSCIALSCTFLHLHDL